MSETKSFQIPKHLVYEAYKRVKANQGGAGVDGKSLKDFESNLKNNLYVLWNDCRQAATCHHRLSESKLGKQMAVFAS